MEELSQHSQAAASVKFNLRHFSTSASNPITLGVHSSFWVLLYIGAAHAISMFILHCPRVATRASN